MLRPSIAATPHHTFAIQHPCLTPWNSFPASGPAPSFLPQWMNQLWTMHLLLGQASGHLHPRIWYSAAEELFPSPWIRRESAVSMKGSNSAPTKGTFTWFQCGLCFRLPLFKVEQTNKAYRFPLLRKTNDDRDISWHDEYASSRNRNPHESFWWPPIAGGKLSVLILVHWFIARLLGYWAFGCKHVIFMYSIYWMFTHGNILSFE